MALVAGTKEAREIARVLLSCLGFPQVTVATPEDDLSQFRGVLLIDDALAHGIDSCASVWRFVGPPGICGGSSTATLRIGADNWPIPARLTHVWAPRPNRTPRTDFRVVCENTCYYTEKRFSKNPTRVAGLAGVDWTFASALQEKLGVGIVAVPDRIRNLVSACGGSWTTILEAACRQFLDAAFRETGRKKLQLHAAFVRRLIAAARTTASLWANFARLMKAPARPERQFELTDASYGDGIPALLGAWRTVIREIFRDMGVSLVWIRPWPSGRDAAVSIRYDIDRPITAARVLEHCRYQRDLTGMMCGSWYVLPQTEDAAVETALRANGQEVGDHLLAAGAGRRPGRTFHSAANSEYWQGAATIDAIERAGGAEYSEFLSAQRRAPGPVLVGDGQALRGTSTWFTPIHFPVEGSTADTDLSYFDRLAPRFDAQLHAGGHMILGTHPDCNERLVELILGRLRSRGCLWYAPVGEVVRRTKMTIGHGQVVGDWTDGMLRLQSRSSVDDVEIVVFPAGEEAGEQRATVDLRGGSVVKLRLDVPERRRQ